ncbi:MAG: response regulator [Oligoflexia bacterium]|nr:response regulator [Oligoflexia bacterium]
MNNSNEIKKETKSKVLIVDDSPVDRELLIMILEEKYSIHALSSAQSCIETIEAVKPDIVLLDVVMPDIDGIQLLINIRKKWSQVELPIIMITANSDSEDITNALNLGANDYITKPVDFVVALKRIETHLGIISAAKEMVNIKELATVSAMIIAYNHEIQNPLSIAIYACDALEKKFTSSDLQNLKTALWRISDVIIKTEKIFESRAVEYEKYVQDTKMIKLNNS